MNLIIEIGNTRTKFAFFETNHLTKLLEYNNEEEIDIDSICHQRFEKAILSGSGNMYLSIWEMIEAKSKLIFDRHIVPQLKYKYKTPETLGLDRIVNAYRAMKEFLNQNSLIIDVGTCITCTFINQNGEIEGGSISPGLMMRAKSLNYYTAKLPLIEIETHTSPILIGSNTQESILSGVIMGSIYEIERRIADYMEIYPDLRIIMTGGDTLFFENKIKYKIFADSHFTLKGLNDILNDT